MPKKEWDYTVEQEFFSSRGKIKKPRKQPESMKVIQDLKKTPPKRRGFGRGNAYRSTVSGVAPDIPGIVFRSLWERNFCRILILHKIDWEFEPQSFIFPPNKNGRVEAYLPDFYLKTDEWVEIKGWLDAKGRSKLRRFKKHYPEEFAKLVVVISRTNTANKTFFTKLGVKKILYYENLRDLYSEKIVNWQ